MAVVLSQKHEATAHTSNANRAIGLCIKAVVLEMFPQHLISCFGDLYWPARSPDL